MAGNKNSGAHSQFTNDIAYEICERLIEGEPLAKICRDEHMPGYRTVHDWRVRYSEFDDDFIRAREDGYDAIAYRLRKTARGKGPEEGGESTGDVQRDKLIIETDLKLLAKWSKRYGDKFTAELTGEGGGAIKSEITVSYVKAIQDARVIRDSED